MKYLAILIFAISGVLAHAEDVGTPLESLPIQDNGRIKPFGTFAQEALQLIYGKKSFQDKSATEVVFTWLLIPEHWSDTPIIEIRHHGLKEALKIDSPEKYFSAKALFENPRIPLVIQELQTKQTRQEKLNPYFSAVQRLSNQIALFQAIRNGQALKFVPSPTSDGWRSVAELDGDLKVAFARLSKGFVDSIAQAPEGKAPQASEEFKTATKDFMALARAQAPDRYADMTRIDVENSFNHLHPFMWAWIAYLIGLLLWTAAASASSTSVTMGRVAWGFLFLGFLLHGAGMAVRVYLAGRPPVSNMYETVVWVPFGCVLFGFILERFLKNKILLACASAVAVFCLILTNLAPAVLDSSIQPLEPVLRSTFWLSTHVLIITISYAAFFLAFAVGDLTLFFYLKGEERYAKQIAQATQSMYRAIQIGVVLLAFGIILGGIWADYSWGRFWGWDPKETWALIALLGYVALLHGRLVGWVKNYQLAVGCVVSFLLVIMAWYGVNMVLGAGLHTYGFGAGGIEYVLGFAVAHILYITYVTTVRYQPSKNSSK